MSLEKHYRFAMASYRCIQRLSSIETDPQKMNYGLALNLRWFHFHAKRFVIESRHERPLYQIQYRALLDAWQALRMMIRAGEEQWVVADW